ncbi:MAG TPA: asparagine synthase (glutamine-hydrolyzing) [Candidatus Hungatella pullicola]|nr:asparagine synthase (glutamine-hydrolyzing) [Candidatus Hungatella pullicola]
MCGIAGFYHREKNYMEKESEYRKLLSDMGESLSRRGPDDRGIWLSSYAGLSHVRLSVVDLVTGHQPIVKNINGNTFAIIHNGEIYNVPELKKRLVNEGAVFDTTSDGEVILNGYLIYGPDFVRQLNGIFAFAIADPAQKRLCLFRDRMGVKPLFYTIRDNEIFFASEIKALFRCPGIKPTLGLRGLNEVFSLGPARTPGCGVFEGIHEVLPAHMLLCSPDGFSETPYWQLESHPHEDSWEKTVEKTSYLIQDSVKRQMVSDVPVCTFLSGGVDSSLVSSICASCLKEKGEPLATYSFDFTGNDKNFRSNAFQPSQDRPYVDEMVQYLGSSHTYLECDSQTQADLLCKSVLAHDLPPMGDIDSSLLHFCSLVSQNHKVALTGECADEIFGGYPWFHKKECFLAPAFPWTMDLDARKVVLKDEFINYLQMDAYASHAYEDSVKETPLLPEESPEEKRRREISWLNLRWFMQTLLNRMDRTSMYWGLEARVPFADHRIVEYLWNVPWEIKAKDGIVKGLLRYSSKGLLPDSILFRKKSPYPKTYDSGYEALLAGRVRNLMETGAPIMEFLDKKKLEQFLSSPSDYGRPWYGQLMAAPQMLAYLLQINFWLETYSLHCVSLS